MKIYDENNNEILNPDLSIGYLTNEKMLLKHHNAKRKINGKGHYVVIKEYPNGGKDVEWVWDIEPDDGYKAWDEYEDILKYTKYTDEELENLNYEENQLTDIQVAIAELYEMIIGGSEK